MWPQDLEQDIQGEAAEDRDGRERKMGYHRGLEEQKTKGGV